MPRIRSVTPRLLLAFLAAGCGGEPAAAPASTGPVHLPPVQAHPPSLRMLAAPESLVAGGDTIRIVTDLGQDFMPSSAPDPGGHPLAGSVRVEPAGSGWTVEAVWILRPDGSQRLGVRQAIPGGVEVLGGTDLPELSDGVDVVVRVRGPGRHGILLRRRVPVMISA